ncbi:MauE/DoxX family redox-associated membrane protein [Ilumatobacter sp.]|uniref:MauE/DoxX family redox-associated membrane protein n=1 Tax=Ilumatobacter sp. TaxID=1967498 RepID=UPI003B522F7E
MDLAAAVASWIVGAALVVAGASKLTAGARWADQARGLGAPGWAAPFVPWVELVLGAMLVSGLARSAAAVAALLLLAAFTLLLARLLRRGEHPPCACFGAWSVAPVGSRHLVRNAALMALSALAAL